MTNKVLECGNASCKSYLAIIPQNQKTHAWNLPFEGDAYEPTLVYFLCYTFNNKVNPIKLGLN